MTPLGPLPRQMIIGGTFVRNNHITNMFPLLSCYHGSVWLWLDIESGSCEISISSATDISQARFPICPSHPEGSAGNCGPLCDKVC